ncbi:hypothetical protein D918_04853, partial [Trichuris suis]
MEHEHESGCSASIAQQPGDKIGGPRHTVETDKSLFSKGELNRARMSPRQWNFDGVCRETRECFLVPVEHRSVLTLIATVKRCIWLGTTIIFDKWRGYRSLSEEDYTDLRVNHSVDFVGRATDAHTQTAESLWAQAK